MLNIRKTLNRVPSFQDILEGRMSHPDMYACLPPLCAQGLPFTDSRPPAVLLTSSSSVQAQLAWVLRSV